MFFQHQPLACREMKVVFHAWTSYPFSCLQLEVKQPCCITLATTLNNSDPSRTKPLWDLYLHMVFICFLSRSHIWRLFGLLACLIVNGNKGNIETEIQVRKELLKKKNAFLKMSKEKNTGTQLSESKDLKPCLFCASSLASISSVASSTQPSQRPSLPPLAQVYSHLTP